jgi:hypothetical protein
MILNETMVLWLIMLTLLVGLFPKPIGWGRLGLWVGLVLLTVLLVVAKALFLRC